MLLLVNGITRRGLLHNETFERTLTSLIVLVDNAEQQQGAILT